MPYKSTISVLCSSIGLTIIYNDISSCVYNNGKTSKYFRLYRGVRQGDPLSPYLFIIALDILARITAQDDKIKGFKISSKEIKMTQYADDLTLMLSNLNSITEALSLLTNLETIQDSKLTKKKLWEWYLDHGEIDQKLPPNITWTDEPI